MLEWACQQPTMLEWACRQPLMLDQMIYLKSWMALASRKDYVHAEAEDLSLDGALNADHTYARGLSVALGHTELIGARLALDVMLFGDTAAGSGDFSSKAGCHQAHRLVWLTAQQIPLAEGQGPELQIPHMVPALAVHLLLQALHLEVNYGPPVLQGSQMIKTNGLKMRHGSKQL